MGAVGAVSASNGDRTGGTVNVGHTDNMVLGGGWKAGMGWREWDGSIFDGENERGGNIPSVT